MTDPADICRALSAGRFDLHDEKECQAQIATWLAERMPEANVSREHRLSTADIPDFFIAGVVVEVKMNAARAASILKQLTRYAVHPEVSAVILVSNRATHLPATVEGKPLHMVSLGRAWL
jgi:hypothetical protein